jgi:hypothetical protein
MAMALGAGVVLLTQWYFRDFSPAFFVCLFFWRTFFFSSRLIISLECVESSSYSLGRFDLRSSPDRFSLCELFLRIREMGNESNLIWLMWGEKWVKMAFTKPTNDKIQLL